jgi:hypothetical protein
MTEASQHSDASTYRVDEDGSLRPVKVEAEPEDIDLEADREYIAMDVFVNPMTMREHFRYSSFREEQCVIHSASAR